MSRKRIHVHILFTLFFSMALIVGFIRPASAAVFTVSSIDELKYYLANASTVENDPTQIRFTGSITTTEPITFSSGYAVIDMVGYKLTVSDSFTGASLLQVSGGSLEIKDGNIDIICKNGYKLAAVSVTGGSCTMDCVSVSGSDTGHCDAVEVLGGDCIMNNVLVSINAGYCVEISNNGSCTISGDSSLSSESFTAVLVNSGTLNLSGNLKIWATFFNLSDNGTGVTMLSKQVINIIGPLTYQTPIKIVPRIGSSESLPVVFTNGFAANNPGKDPLDYFSSTGSEYFIVMRNGEAAVSDVRFICETAEHGSVTADNTKAASGQTVTLTVTPEEGYELDTLSVRDSKGKDVTVTDNTFVVPDANYLITVTATFRLKTYTVTYKVVNGTWEDGQSANKTENVLPGGKPSFVPTGMKPGKGYDNGKWDKDPASSVVTSDTVFTYTFSVKEEEKQPQSDENAVNDMSKDKDEIQTEPVPLQDTVTITDTTPKTLSKTGTPKTVSGTPLAKMSAKGKTSLKFTWKKVNGAEGYDIFFAACGKNDKKTKCKLVRTITGNSKFSWTKTKLKAKKAYKAYVKAWVIENGRKKYVAASPTVHAFTANGTKTQTNAKSVTVEKTKISVKKGKTKQIKADVKKVKSKLSLMSKSHAAKLRYLCTNKKIATVNKKGKIRGVSKGSCYVYVYAHNGVSKTIKVTVR